MVVLALLIAVGIFFLIFKLWQTSLKDIGVNGITAIIGAIVILLFIITCFMD